MQDKKKNILENKYNILCCFYNIDGNRILVRCTLESAYHVSSKNRSPRFYFTRYTGPEIGLKELMGSKTVIFSQADRSLLQSILLCLL